MLYCNVIAFPGDVNTKRPSTEICAVPGTRAIHQAERVADWKIKTRKLACFCVGCEMRPPRCLNAQYVGSFELRTLTVQKKE